MKLVSPIFLGVLLASVTLPIGAQQPTTTQFNLVPSRIVGQAVLQQQGLLTATAPNLVEGREFDAPQALAIDQSASPPILYVADFQNNRVLAWKNAAAFTNGGPFADLVIGQRDLLSTGPQGPAGDLSTGLTGPIALTVDSKGNLYVADAGNNRIVRYPAPFSQTGSLLTVDLVIGQKDLSGRAANQGTGAPSATSLFLSSGSTFLRSGLAFDSSGNLWVSDAGNNRVLRYPSSVLGQGATNAPSADLVLGQTDFTLNQLPNTAGQSKCVPTNLTGSPCGKSYLSQPSGLAFDPAGRLFVPDSLNRVVVFTPPFSIGQLAARIMGIDPGTPPQPPPTISASTLGTGNRPPEGVFFVGSNPFVVDTGNNRILGYDSFDQWTPESATAFSPAAKKVVGQQSFTANQSNQGMTQPSASTLSGPVGGVAIGTDIYVVDSSNNRLLVFPQQGNGLYLSATRLLGQIDFPYNSVNLIEGREVGFTANFGSCLVNGALPFASGGRAVIDASSTPPHLYIADPTNNRVLGYKDYRLVKAGSTADVVLGQPDLRTAMLNYPTGSTTQTNDTGMWTPESIAVDSNGNVYVADTCNGRVLRFPSPFSQPSGIQRANLVLGQTSFFGQPIHDLSRQTMRSAYGLAFTVSGHLVVSDPLANRILFFLKPGGGDFQNGQPATNVFGQPDFSSGFAITFNSPRGLAIDPDDQLYVADTLNNRIAILPNVPTAGDNPPVLFSITSVGQPFGVAINQTTDEIWVTNTSGNAVLRYPNYVTVINNPATTATLSPISAPLGISLDPFGNPVVTEGINRVSFYYPAIDFTTSAGGVTGRLSGNGANYFGRWAPGMLASLFSFTNTRFGDQTVVNSTIPLPTTLGDVQVFVAGVAAPLLYVSPTQINLQIPSSTPTGGFQEFLVVRASTGQVLASWLFRIDAVSPGLFTANATGSGQLLAVNVADGSVNNASHPAKAGTYVQLYGTGQGIVSGMPPDGVPTPGSILNTNTKPMVVINGTVLADADVQFSGLAPGFVGLWQINAKIPANVPPADVPVFVSLNGINSVTDPNGIRRVTTIRTAP